MLTRSSSHTTNRLNGDSSTLTRLFQARNEYDRLYQLSNLLKEARIDLPDFFESSTVWTTICRESNSEKLAWRLAREIALRTKGKVPLSLQPYANRPEFEEEDRAEEEALFNQKLTDWLMEGREDSAGGNPKRDLRVVWRMEAGHSPLDPRVTIELRVNSPKLKEGARNCFQVRGLCNEATNRPELFSPEDQVLLRWLSDFHTLLLTDKNRVNSPFLHDNRSLLTWLVQWGQSGRCLWEDSKPVEFSPISARIIPRIGTNNETSSSGSSPGNGPQVELGFEIVTANGIREPLNRGHIFLAPKTDQARPELELICLGNCFYRLVERPPRTLLSLVLKNGPSWIGARTASRLLPPLLRRFPSLQSQVKVHLRQVPSQVRFYCNLDEEDSLQVRLIASAKKGDLMWEWADDGWKRTTQDAIHGSESSDDESFIYVPGPEIVSGDAIEGSEGYERDERVEVWDDVPAEADTALALEWLLRLGVERGELCGRADDTGWWLLIQPNRIGPLLQHWRDRSGLWQFFANRRFQNLVIGKRRRFPKLKIQSTGIDWFSVEAKWEDSPDGLQEDDWLKLQNTDDPYVKLSNGAWVPRDEAVAMAEAVKALAEIGVQVGEGEQQVGTWQMSNAREQAWKKLENLAEGDEDEGIKQLRDAVENFQGLPEIEIPATLRADLRPYQKTGLQFLAYAARYKLGALLADDMGLGKTVQALAWLEHLRVQKGRAPSLVICPASVVFNWHKEAQQFVPEQKVLLLTAGENRHNIRREIPNHDLVVTNYALLRRDLSALQKFSFRAIILDEAQNIKNPDSMVARAAKALKAEHKLALTGTPLENRLLDLWSIMEFVHPGYLPEKSKFLEQYDRGASQPARALLSSRLRPIMLRRLKRQVAEDLPDRIEERMDCELTEGQRKFYVAELQRSRQALSQLDMQLGQSRMHVLAALTRLRQICCHPMLAGGKKGLGSGKTSALMEILEPLYAGGHKVLVFSQFVEMLKILKTEMEERGRPYFMLTGQTTQRAEVVSAFHACKEPAVFLLSLKAAGTGLNLTAASYVVLYDPWWNPAVEAQAIDRTHRIGQDRTVIAYRLVTRGTVEEKIWHLQQVKAQMAQDVLGEEGFTGSLSKKDFEYLLDDSPVEWENGPVPKE